MREIPHSARLPHSHCGPFGQLDDLRTSSVGGILSRLVPGIALVNKGRLDRLVSDLLKVCCQYRHLVTDQ